jgi:undecaprenyl-diphosphatase
MLLTANADWRLYHSIYEVSLHHRWLGSFFHGLEQASIPLVIVATAALWVAGRVRRNERWQLASIGGFAAAALALAVNRVIAAAWKRPRPFVAHRIPHPWINTHDASFPSDHASASLAIAFAILAVDPPVGVVYAVLAVLVAVGRLFIGAHYPGDIGASAVVALVVAVVVTRLGRPLLRAVTRGVNRVADAVLPAS